MNEWNENDHIYSIYVIQVPFIRMSCELAWIHMIKHLNGIHFSACTPFKMNVCVLKVAFIRHTEVTQLVVLNTENILRTYRMNHHMSRLALFSWKHFHFSFYGAKGCWAWEGLMLFKHTSALRSCWEVPDLSDGKFAVAVELDDLFIWTCRASVSGFWTDQWICCTQSAMMASTAKISNSNCQTAEHWEEKPVYLLLAGTSIKQTAKVTG